MSAADALLKLWASQTYGYPYEEIISVDYEYSESEMWEWTYEPSRYEFVIRTQQQGQAPAELRYLAVSTSAAIVTEAGEPYEGLQYLYPIERHVIIPPPKFEDLIEGLLALDRAQNRPRPIQAEITTQEVKYPNDVVEAGVEAWQRAREKAAFERFRREYFPASCTCGETHE
jgi:hypothetical protein